MKKILVLLMCLFTVSTAMRAEDDKTIRFDQLPAKAQEYVRKYFPNDKVALTKMEKDWFDKSYEVIFTNSIKVEFYKNGDWKEVDCKYATVPEAAVPAPILRYVNTNHAGQSIVKMENGSRDYEVKLFNGLELKFDKKYNLINMDN